MSRFTDPEAAADEKPRDAATVVLLREDAADEEPSVFLMKRNSKTAFMAGAFVFPGGRVDAADAGWADADASASPPDAVQVAGCREMFEEAGVLLALDGSGQTAEAPADGWAELRERVHEDATTFAAVLADLNVTLNRGALLSWSHWITPSAEHRRYNTYFFIARMPDGQSAVHDDSENVLGEWYTASDALAAHAVEAIFLPPPTRFTLEELAGKTWREIAEFQSRRMVAPILPKLLATETAIEVVLPWDERYAALEGEGIDVPNHPQSTLRTSYVIDFST